MTTKLYVPMGKIKLRPIDRRDKNFKRPFVLCRSNIRSFMAKHVFYDGKFVFDLSTKRLALGETTWQHKDIAGLKFGNSDLKGKCGAFILISKEENEIIIRLAGKSGHFGQPTRVDLDLVIDHINNLLDALGITPYRTRITDAGNVFIFANYTDSFPQASYTPAGTVDDVPVLHSS